MTAFVLCNQRFDSDTSTYLNDLTADGKVKMKDMPYSKIFAYVVKNIAPTDTYQEPGMVSPQSGESLLSGHRRIEEEIRKRG